MEIVILGVGAIAGACWFEAIKQRDVAIAALASVLTAALVALIVI